MTEQLVICDHVDKCPRKCGGAGVAHEAVGGGCRAGHNCATVDAVVRCIPVEQPAVEQLSNLTAHEAANLANACMMFVEADENEDYTLLVRATKVARLALKPFAEVEA